MNGATDSVGSTRRGYPNAAGSADLSLFLHHPSRVCNQKAPSLSAGLMHPHSPPPSPLLMRKPSRAAVFQRASRVLASSIKPWGLTSFSCFHISHRQGISSSQGGYCNNKCRLIPNHLRVVCHRFTLTLLKLCCFNKFQIWHLKRGVHC